MGEHRPRDLRIVVDAGAETCGPCHRRYEDASHSRCGVFGHLALRRLENGDHERSTGCLAAEQAARPWEGDPDNRDGDDGFPMHLATPEASK